MGVVGAGRVGAVLASALRAAGHTVVGASAVSHDSRDRVDALLPGVPVLEVPDVVERAELILLTVPDDALAGLVQGIADTGGWQPGQIVVHTAGRYGTDVLAPAQRAGAIPVALHPAMTFTGTSIDLARLVGCPFAVTAPGPVLPIGQALVVEIGGEPVALPEAARPLYHAALAHGANHLVTLVTQAMRVLGRAGVDEPGLYLGPLLTAALDGTLRDGELALTGPVLRGDAGTVAEHVATLVALAAEDAGLSDLPPAYRTLSRVTTQRAWSAGRLTDSAAQLLLDAVAETPALEATSHPAAGDDAAAEPAPSPVLVRTRADLREVLDQQRGTRAVVMTMGALHEGHLDLVREARRRADHVVVTIFVNPLQFAPGEDLDAYPRDLEADLAMLASVGADVVFAPGPDMMYPDGDPRVRVDPGPLASVLEGATRPTHFGGVLTVVLKLLHLTRPHVALFGQKDAQQLALVRAMVRDLDVDVEVVGVPIRREPDGLAMSSRNAYLGDADRSAALALSAALEAGRAAAGAGAEQVLAAAREHLAAEPGVRLDYLELVDPETMEPVSAGASGPCLLVVAAWVGSTRLIDNTILDLWKDE
ncbi:pantoate--beta-alanine ligase [Georgenia satyanarayanai]|uniref:Pantothenate synthetase n=1 Tax=Georgenia satyanarayanai TaxID=860221 RepID=A0A2Y9AGH1_9MICO|nr:pantoate--beta-alanine ligase [Georgenia satyanarayanai]SSA42378.1 pantoate--beta-alanine ligase [Georgenia satyanarayanai]